MSDVKLFENPEFGQIRVIVNNSNEPLFCLVDVCRVLELTFTEMEKRLQDGVAFKLRIGTEMVINDLRL